MRIAKISTYILKVPLGEKRFFSSQCAFPERNSLLVKVETEDGLYGWGEGGQYGPAEPVKACIDSVLAPFLIGKNPLNKGVLWDEMYAGIRDFGQKGSYIEAISALDIALWDLCGKQLGVPVAVLLGGVKRTSVTAYATGCYYRGTDYLDLGETLRELEAEAKGYVDQGFRILKLKVGLLSVEDDAKRVAAIRHAVGDKVTLLADCNHAYNAYTAVRMGRYLEEQKVIFMEEPVLPEDREGYKAVRASLDMAIAGGECEYTSYGFRDLIAGGCVDIVQPDICVSGGLTEFKRIQALAGVFGVHAIPHVWGSGIALAAALAAIASMPLSPHTANPIPLQNEPVVEYDRNFNPLRDELLTTPIIMTDSRVQVPLTSGLGVDVNMETLKKYAVSV